MAESHHQGEPTSGSQLSGLLAMVLLAVLTFVMFFTSVTYSSSAAEGEPGRPVPTVVRR